MRRRSFLLGVSAGIAAHASPVWADFGETLYLSAANQPDKSTWLAGLSLSGAVRFALPIPGRGHAAAVHPERAVAVAFARRPGDFALILDCASGQELARLTSPEGAHFYGHGAFTADGSYLLTTENAYDIPDGRIGVWDAANGYVRVGDFASGGIGPHEIIRLGNGDLAVANGGIQTHPDFARAKLNIPTMQTNLSFVSATGTLLETQPLVGDMVKNSVRHIDVDAAGRIVAALQWQGAPTQTVPLVARFTRGGVPELLSHPAQARLKNYAGSIAVSPDGREIAVTGPKGNHVIFLDSAGQPLDGAELPVASGVAQTRRGLVITCKGGLALRQDGGVTTVPVTGGWFWDNHLVRVG